MPLFDNDNGSILPERNIKLPWSVNPVATWLDYQCWTECLLDAGMALHKPLPQVIATIDTLASAFTTDSGLDSNTGGVNLSSFNNAADVIQRMATSTYTFILKGYGLRVGYTIPVPGIQQIGGVVPTPGETQWSNGNQVVGNFSGIPVFFNAWVLEYIIDKPLKPSSGGGGVSEVIPPNLAMHIRGDAQLPLTITMPWTQPDQNSFLPPPFLSSTPPSGP